jgi:drug/metabolite transporter (DMT)-like permease
MNAFSLALVCAVLYAVSDICVGLASKHNKPYKVNLFQNGIVLLFGFVPLVTLYRDELSRLTFLNFALITGSGFVVIMGTKFFVKAMNVGSVTTAGVVAGIYPVVTYLAAILFYGERPTLLKSLIFAIIIIGVFFSSLKSNMRNFVGELKSSGTLYALYASLLWGVYFAYSRTLVDRVGWFTPIYFANLVGFLVNLYAGYREDSKHVFRLPKRLWAVAGMGLIGTSTAVLYNYALSLGKTTTIVAVAGSSPAFFVLFAFLIFREKLKPTQWLGFTLVIAGIIALNL